MPMPMPSRKGALDNPCHRRQGVNLSRTRAKQPARCSPRDHRRTPRHRRDRLSRMAQTAPLPADPTADPTDDPTVAELLAARPCLTMHAMDGLTLESTPLNRIGDALGTPTWVYGAGTMRARYRMLANALSDAGLDTGIHYAIKANDHLAILRLFAAEGAG